MQTHTEMSFHCKWFFSFTISLFFVVITVPALNFPYFQTLNKIWLWFLTSLLSYMYF